MKYKIGLDRVYRAMAWALASCLFITGLSANQVVTFELLGESEFRPADLSQSGLKVVGHYYAETNTVAYIWEDGLMSEIPDSNGAIYPFLSDDGQHIVTKILVPDSANFSNRWDFNPQEGWVNEGPLGIQFPEGVTEVKGLSEKGETVVGEVRYPDSQVEAFAWSMEEPESVTLLGFLNEGDTNSYAIDVSADGSVIAGMINSGPPNYYVIPVQWINGQISALETLSGYESENYRTFKISADGTKILGTAFSQSNGLKVILWTNGIPEILLEFTPDENHPTLIDASRDMKTIILEGYDSGFLTYYATEANDWSLVPLTEFAKLHGADFEFDALNASAISADGSTIVGRTSKLTIALPFRLQIFDRWGPYPVEQGYVDTGPWLKWLWVENDPWVWSVDLNHWLYCPGETVGEGGAWVYMPK